MTALKPHPKAPSSDEAPISYQVRRSERASKTRIIVSADKIEVVAPLKTSEQRIHAFVATQRDWIRDAQKRVEQRAGQIKSLAPPAYVDGAPVPFQGRQIPLEIKPGKHKNPRVQFTGARFEVYLNQAGADNGSDSIKTALQTWMKQHTRQMALQLLEKHRSSHGLLPRSLRIKTQKSRWGSCGPHNDINLNWLLVLAPPVIMEYVVVHELCHIRHKNHSRDFWQLVSAHMPDYLEHRQWLKQHGGSLMRGL
ncbi:M48 family metallopeptidase [Methylomonas sp. SURF-2]|uniref:M48 family metallopeptidase n=1 Tax=Methylomonas subterranea TaxID=2952225 RepID=A0ABT1TF03_9GAMM|nr:SprT family zinc-dependent metalloprotease [Methylomonas sp. SURF-2]MCQ8103831.1 M48 family metallopeptidase [Methylomonas sp. SURF-2]